MQPSSQVYLGEKHGNGNFSPEIIEYEHHRRLADPGSPSAQASSEESPRLDILPVVGPGGAAPGMPLFTGKRLQPHPKPGDHSR